MKQAGNGSGACGRSSVAKRHFDEPLRRYYTGLRDMEPRTERFYRENADALADDYDRADPTYLAQVRTLAGADARIVDVGCGTGRDVARLREAGLNAIGVDGSEEMVTAGTRRYGLPQSMLAVDTLPELATLGDRRFEVVLCAAVLQHISDETLMDALYRLRSLVAPGGFLVLSVPAEYPLHAASIDQSGRLFRLRPPQQYTFLLERLGLKQIVSYDESDGLGRPDRLWRVLVYSAGEGSELRPVETIESILWDDSKVTTYKFALVRSLAHLAVHRHRAARWHDDGRVSVDIDDVAALWIRYYWPLVVPTGDREILQGQRSTVSSRSDMGFRADLRTLAGQWERQGGYAAFRAWLESGRLGADSAPLVKSAMRKIKSAIRQPIRYAGNERTGKMLFSYAQGRVYLPGNSSR